MSKLNLAKLIYDTPGVGPHHVELALGKVFPVVFSQERKDPFFNFQLTCLDDENRVRLIVRYGWSPKHDWLFEPLAPEVKK